MLKGYMNKTPELSGQDITFGFFEEVMPPQESQKQENGHWEDITFGFFEEVMHLEEIKKCIGFVPPQESQKQENGHWEDITFGFFEEVMHLEEIKKCIEFVPPQESQKQENGHWEEGQKLEKRQDQEELIKEEIQKVNLKKRLVKLQMDRETAVYHQPAGFGYITGAKLTGGGERGTKSGNSGKFKRLNLAQKRDMLEKVCRGQNLQNLKPEGPYGEACTLLRIKNTHANRKRVQTFWQRYSKLNANKLKKEDNAVIGSKKSIETPESVHTDASNVQRNSKRKVGSLPSTPTKRIKCGNEICKTQTTSKSPTPLQSGEKMIYTITKQAKTPAKGLCICGATETNWEENGDMAECEACHQWYHFKCICNKKVKVAKKTDVKFICGQKNCTYKGNFLMVKGTIYPFKPEVSNCEFDLGSKEPTNKPEVSTCDVDLGSKEPTKSIDKNKKRNSCQKK